MESLSPERVHLKKTSVPVKTAEESLCPTLGMAEAADILGTNPVPGALGSAEKKDNKHALY